MTPRDEIQARLRALRAALDRAGLDALYLDARADVRYASGFTGDDSAVLVARRRQWLVTDFRYREEAEASAPLFPAVVWKEHPARHAGALAVKAGARRVGFDPRRLRVAAHRELRRGAKGAALVDAGAVLPALRAVKSAWERARIRRALRIAERAFVDLRATLRPGQTERDVRHVLEEALRRHGSERPAFPTIVAADANASRPHAHPGARKLRAGGRLLVDFGAVADGYASDATRTLFLGDPGKTWRDRYAWTLMALAAGTAAARAGVTGDVPDEAARAVFRAAGVEEHFGHGLGHGVGLEVHEEPRLARRARRTLAPGMVTTVEPGLYWPGRGGLRIEDMALVTEGAARVLTRLPKGLDWAVL